MRGLAGGGPRWSPSGWQEGCARVWGTPCKLWGDPGCKELDPIRDVVEGLPADVYLADEPSDPDCIVQGGQFVIDLFD